MQRESIACIALAVCGCAVGAAPGAVFFTFEDPGTGPEITYTTGDAMNPGVMTFTGANPITLEVDGTDEMLGSTSFTATVSMNLQIGAVSGMAGPTMIAPILGGTFSFVDMGSGDTILSAAIGDEDGAVLSLGTTGSVIATGSGDPAALVMTAGDALAAFLGGLVFAPTFDAVFTLTQVNPEVFVNDDGFLTSFQANTAFTGNAEVIPTPGSMALLGLSGAVLAIRRKR